ncbi:MAG: hypothetical protein ACOX4G_06745 [Limnochordia bacterium]|jgi:hypothetical protein
MGLPEFPELPTAPTLDELRLLLIETVALEELALAALINAEAEKVQAVADADVLGPVSAEELAAINKAVAEVINAAACKEDRLRQKLALLLAMSTPVGGT